MRFRKTSLLTKLLLLAAVVYALVTLVRLQDRVAAANARVETLEEQVLYAEQECALVEQELSELGTDKSVMKIARARLGMVEAGEIVLYDADVQ
jgi:Septum formation initiator